MTHADAVRERRLVLREFLASALYLALVLLAVLVAAPDDRLPAEGPLVGLLVGTAIGLPFAHWFAFRLAADLTALDETDAWAAGKEALAQIAGGVAVVLVAAAPFVVLDGAAARDASRLMLAALPAVSGAAIARVRGRSWPWVVVAGVVAFGVAVVVVAVKNAAGH